MRFWLTIIGIGVVAPFLGCDLIFEERRLRAQTEADLHMVFEEPPKLLANESFGSVEEGGDRALLQVASQDCAKLDTLLTDSTPLNNTSDYYRMFQAEGLRSLNVRSRYWTNQHGDSKHYVLDTDSCVLYREAFFE